MPSHIARRGGYRTTGLSGNYGVQAPAANGYWQFAVTANAPATNGQGGAWPVYVTANNAGGYKAAQAAGMCTPATLVGRYTKADGAISATAHRACANAVATVLVGLVGLNRQPAKPAKGKPTKG
jgi:hypothetical protein